MKERGIGRLKLSGMVHFSGRSYLRLSCRSGAFSTMATTFNVHGFRGLSRKLHRVYQMLGGKKRLYVIRLAAPIDFPVGRLFRVCSRAMLPVCNGLVSGSRDTCDCLAGAVRTFPRKRAVVRMFGGTKFRGTRFGELAFNVYALCFTAGWGGSVVSGCKLVNCPLKRSFSGNCFGRGFRGRNVSTRCVGFRVPSVRSLARVLSSGPRLGNLGMAVPCGRGMVDCLSRIDPRTGTVKTIGIIGIRRGNSRAVLGKCGDSIVNFARDVRPFVRSFRGGTLVLNANNTSGTVGCNLGSLKLRAIFIDQCRHPNAVRCSGVAPRIVGRCGIVIGYAPMNVCPRMSRYPPLPCRTVSARALLCSLVCGPSRALFVGGKGRRRTAIGGNLRVLLLRTFTS